ncbi:MAG TPA: SRPBCC family protein [Candidatus Limnocylindrales bacterium]|jgi:uncharacterized membrane protein|nr:SRPBCC family protein [Candidatus Limnocylindrales bacterium]
MAGNDKKWMLFGGAAAGAAAFYFLDREKGHQRRATAALATNRLAQAIADGAALGVRDAQQRLTGMAKHAWFSFRREHLDDRVLVERIRSRMGRILSHPHKIHVASDRGTVTLWGQAPREQARELIEAVNSMQGVREIFDHLEDWEPEAGHAAAPRAFHDARLSTLLNWNPTQRLFAGLAGGALSVYGFRRNDALGNALSGLGTGIVVQSLLKRNVRSILALTEDCPGFELERTIRVNIPISDLYDFWVNPENYPKVFGHIANVERLGENLYRWTVNGPAGVPVHWEGVITRKESNTLVEWKSVPGSTIGNFGLVRFDANYDASTRLHIRMFYRPPAGILGRFIAELFGADPGQLLTQDLKRMKALFEQDETLVKQIKEGGDEQLLKIAKT